MTAQRKIPVRGCETPQHGYVTEQSAGVGALYVISPRGEIVAGPFTDHGTAQAWAVFYDANGMA